MIMRIQMQLQCVECGTSRMELVPARFHYSDGCYTVLTIEEPSCECLVRRPLADAGDAKVE